MHKREDYMAGVPCYVDSGRKDSAPAREFYGGLLGWEFENVSPGGEAPPYHAARLNGLTVAGVGTQPWQDWTPVWNTYVRVEDADEAGRRVTDAGGKVEMEPFSLGEVGRWAAFSDPQGAQFCVWEAGQTKGVELVNDIGAWVFSGLHTPDLRAAEQFYGAVFGWEMSPELGMIRMPGYGEFLEQSDPGIRQRHKEAGAPEGFSDVVAQVMEGEQAYWDVTFSVEDADGTAERTRELGGEVVTEPYDAPWVRMAVIRDPDGTEFTASQFVPPEPAA